MEIIDRNNKIAALRREGLSPPAIARAVGMSATGVRYVLNTHKDINSKLPIPQGISLRAARALWLSIGRWPVAEEAEEIAKSRPGLLRTIMRRQDIAELDRWLESLGMVVDWEAAQDPNRRI